MQRQVAVNTCLSFALELLIRLPIVETHHFETGLKLSEVRCRRKCLKSAPGKGHCPHAHVSKSSTLTCSRRPWDLFSGSVCSAINSAY